MLNDKVDRKLQESILAVLVGDDEEGGKFARRLDPEKFDGDYEEVARRAGRYWATYNRAPKSQIDELFIDIAKDKTGRGLTYSQLFVHLLMAYQDGINTQFLFDSVDKFERKQDLKRLTQNISQAVQAKEEAALEECDKWIDDYRRQRVEAGGKRRTAFEVDSILGSLGKISREFDTGIGPLDKGYVIPARSELMALLGTSGSGKSWGLVHIAKRALFRRRKVLYVTCEMSPDAVMSRFYQSILAVPKRSSDADVTRFLLDDGKVAGFARERVQADFALLDSNAPTEVSTKLRNLGWMFKNIIVTGYSMGELTPARLEAALDYEATVHSFVPDMVMVDYLGIMKVDTKDMRISMGQNAKDLRGIAQRRNIAMVIAQQISREGKNVEEAGRLVDVQHTAEDWSLIGTADIALTMSRTKLESELGLMRLLTAKVRGEQSQYTVLCTQDYPRGQFVLETYRMPNKYKDLLKAFAQAQEGEATKDDED
mgnify:CR=1 FL=1